MNHPSRHPLSTARTRLMTLVVVLALALATSTVPTARAAQVPGSISVAPDSYFGYIPLSAFGGNTVLAVGNDGFDNLPVPAFVYAGETYTTLGITANGFLVVGGATADDLAGVNQNFPDPAAPNNVLAPFWTDLNPEIGGQVLANVLTDGVSSWIVVEWERVADATDPAQVNTFQIWIGVNGAQDVTFAYSVVGSGAGGLLTVGAENADGTSGQAVYYNGTGSLPTEGAVLRVTHTPEAPAPTISLTAPTEGVQYTLNQVVNAAYTCADAGSVVESCTGTVANGAAIDTSSVGTKTFTVTATNTAGKTSTLTVTYSVAYAFSGFSSPVDAAPTLNTAKAGQSIPLKWRLTDANGLPITNLNSVEVTVAALNCASGTTSDAIEEYAAGGSGLQNLGNGSYQFNWKTPKSYAGSCKILRLDLGEGSFRTALFQFK